MKGKTQQITPIETFKKKLLGEGYLVSKKDEQAYARENGLVLKRLENGTRILASQKITPDERYSSVYFNMSSGSYFDPLDKRGAHHFLEHLFFSGKLSTYLNKHYINHNAYTTQTRVALYNAGIYNLSFQNTGLLQGLPKTVQHLISPIGISDETKFGFEKNVILREVAEHNGNYKALMTDKLYETLLKPENPLTLNALGTEESVSKITKKDIYEIFEKVAGTKNFIVSILSSGEGKEAHSLTEYIEKQLDTFPRSGEYRPVDLALYSHIKPLPIRPLRIKLPINNNIVAIFLVWILPIEGFSEEAIAVNFLMPNLRNILFNDARDRGLGYTVDFYQYHFLPNKMMLSAMLLVPSDEEERCVKELTALVLDIVERVKNDTKELEELLGIEKASQKAAPISQKGKLDSSLSTLTDFDLLTNSEVGRKIYLSVTVPLLQKILSQIQNQKPATIVIGDLA